APGIPAHAFWFGEDQARYVITAKQSQPLIDRAKSAGVVLIPLGATGGTVLAIAGERPLLVDDLKRRSEAWLPAYMAGGSCPLSAAPPQRGIAGGRQLLRMGRKAGQDFAAAGGHSRAQSFLIGAAL